MHCLVLDTGKTHCKLAVVSSRGEIHAIETLSTPILNTQFYPAIDTDLIFEWFIEQAKVFFSQWNIDRIISVSHGATAALLNNTGELALPILDYEYEIPNDIKQAYEAIRPNFSETLSPNLPLGLNIGTQIYFQAKQFPEQFKTVTHILMYPQYWANRLSGVIANEITSLGVHTDLWDFNKWELSSLVKSENWASKFPKNTAAWEQLGTLKPALKNQLGIDHECAVHCGVHDSNSALFPYILQANKSDFTLLSTGTWFIAMSPNTPVVDLDGERDCLANIDVFSRPIACARFMGGREHEIILGDISRCDIDEKDITAIIEEGIFALPHFVNTGGPFPDKQGKIIPNQELTQKQLNAVATLYITLLSDQCLSLVNSRGDLYVEGPLVNNQLFCSLLASLRGQDVYICEQAYGVTLGAAMLSYWPEIKETNIQYTKIVASLTDKIVEYKKHWLEHLTMTSLEN